jgi:hypothetical protein
MLPTSVQSEYFVVRRLSDEPETAATLGMAPRTGSHEQPLQAVLHHSST